ncbi:MAG: hypothetical protein QF440_05170 [Candidatus Thalassarchaeaceae archaeon]|jgi:hypothetical protein|nr:hypothetical protein [Candidatus Thalassarchaeaceae archaeon]
MDDLWYLAAAYASMIGLIGWFTWQILDRLSNVKARLDAVEDTLGEKDSEEIDASSEE